MNRILDIKQYQNKNANSIIGFDNQGGDGWERWHRFITINGKRIFEIGNICGTCEIYFKKLQELNPEIDETEIANMLNSGINEIDDSALELIMKLMPMGSYTCTLSKINPKENSTNDYFSNEQRKTWGSEKFSGPINNPETNYFRGADFKMKDKELFIELIIPTQNTKLDEQRIELYSRKLKDGQNTTCLCLSVLDIKAPAMWENEIEPEFDTHWCMANYVVDGHHKIEASSRTGIPITMLSLINKNESIVDKVDQVNKLIKEMESQPITSYDQGMPPTSALPI